MGEKDRAEEIGEKADEALRESRREAADRRIEDQGAEGGLTEATHDQKSDPPERDEGKPPVD